MGTDPRARRGARRALAALALLPAACLEPTRGDVPAYEAALPGVGVYHWPIGRTLRVYVDEPGAGAGLRAATRVGLAAWRDVMYYREHALELTSDPRDADILVRLAGAPRRVGTAGCDPGSEGSAGLTFFCPAGLKPPAQDSALTLPLLAGGPGRVKVEVTVDPSQAPAAGLDALVAHELGHALGIGGHSPEPGDLMHASPAVARPTRRDGETLRWVLRVVPRVRL